ncbi:hypothetical protein PHLCEN_2v5021 [Hermanssonia centrifuga]|uniref:Uncharacterized protein n=1 Tax=Hermanssonia centrifuga TaxID=98765 RepID=A0A2R6PC73_9APHY|nr:hypothetical protein PHLCEN_2v5021 [Hermanssonia centrifuga]
MAQFPDVEHAVSAVQEILNSPNGTHIRKLISVNLKPNILIQQQSVWSFWTITVSE